jgi:hypothetical protein
MTEVIRFAYVSPAKGAAHSHRFYGRKFVEGERTACGIHVRAGWFFWYGKRGKRPPLCTHCLRAGST